MITKRIPIFAIIISLFNISQANDGRFSGMGNLSFIFQDDFNQLNLYDFAEMPAGFFDDDSFSLCSVTAAGLKERWWRDSVTYWALGQVFPENLTAYVPFEALSFLGFADVPRFSLPANQLRYESRELETGYGSFGEELTPQAWGVYGSYSELNREYSTTLPTDVIRTPELFLVYARPLSENMLFGVNADGFYGLYRSADEEEEAILKPIGGAMGISYKTGPLIIGMNADYHYPVFEFIHSMFANEYREEFRGHAFSPAIAGIVNTGKFIWANVFSYKSMNLSGIARDSTNETALGTLAVNDYSWKSQMLFQPNFMRFTVFGKFDTKNPIFTEVDSDTDFATVYRNYTGVLGFGVDLPVIRAGFEGQYTALAADDKMQDTITEGLELIFKVGGEFIPTDNIALRCGYNYHRIDPNTAVPNDQIISDLVTYGLGIKVTEKIKCDFAYNYRWYSFQDDIEQKVTDQALFCYIKYIF